MAASGAPSFIEVKPDVNEPVFSAMKWRLGWYPDCEYKVWKQIQHLKFLYYFCLFSKIRFWGYFLQYFGETSRKFSVEFWPLKPVSPSASPSSLSARLQVESVSHLQGPGRALPTRCQPSGERLFIPKLPQSMLIALLESNNDIETVWSRKSKSHQVSQAVSLTHSAWQSPPVAQTPSCVALLISLVSVPLRPE